MRCSRTSFLAAAAAAAALLLALPFARAVETLPELRYEKNTPSWPGTIAPVTEVDIQAYTGRWFQVYANYIVQYTFELGGVCVTADYGLLPDGTGVSVHNAQNILKPNGTTTIINGQATAKNASEPGKLTVSFDSVPFPGSYWIVKLGPVVGGEYQYSVVTDAYAVTLFILARDPVTFAENYEKEAMEFVNPLFAGFLRKPRPTVQGQDCLYSPVPSVSGATEVESEDVSVESVEVAVEEEEEENMVDPNLTLGGPDAMAEDVARVHAHGALRAGGPN